MDDIKEIKADVKELLQRSAVHNAILAEHKNFSVALQNEQKLLKSELEPIKEHVSLVSKILKGIGLITVAVIGHWVIKRFL